jgi:hypothetical protein
MKSKTPKQISAKIKSLKKEIGTLEKQKKVVAKAKPKKATKKKVVKRKAVKRKAAKKKPAKKAKKRR